MDRIDLVPLKPGWGCIWQGSELDDWFNKVPQPKYIISMIPEIGLGPSICWYIKDDIPPGHGETLPDAGLLAMCDAAIGFLSNGYNLLCHCFEGKYRSTYMDVAIHMRAGMGMSAAFEMIKARHPIAALRPETDTQLRRMELTLNGGQK